MKTLNITWDDDLHRQVKAAAAALGITINTFQERAARELLVKLKRDLALAEGGI